MTPYPYQEEIANQVVSKLRSLGICYLAAEVRTGKTIMSCLAAQRYGAESVLFLTVKKAIPGIKKDVAHFPMNVDVMSIDSAHKVVRSYDLYIIDEAHGLGTYPKPNKRARTVIYLTYDRPVILMSGTPNPETLSQLFHQFVISKSSPWVGYRSFYKWARDGYVDIKQRRFPHGMVNDYSGANEAKILEEVGPYFVRLSQDDIQFDCPVREHTITVSMSPNTMAKVNTLKAHKILPMDYDTVMADTPVKLLSKVHQLCSGTVIGESGDVHILDTAKVDYILRRWPKEKKVIFYKYTGELQMLGQEMGDSLTTDIEVFNTTDKSIALQIRAGSQGVNLSKGNVQIVLTPDFSSKDRIQSRARMQAKNASDGVDVYYLFSKGGVEAEIWEVLQTKEKYTSAYFKSQYF